MLAINPSMHWSRAWILWIDCLGALIVGAVVILVCGPLSFWEGISKLTVFALGVANLVYGSYSAYVLSRGPRPLVLVQLLAIANMFWIVVCVLIVVYWWSQITSMGLIHILGEGVYVAGLGYAEWRMRKTLSEF